MKCLWPDRAQSHEQLERSQDDSEIVELIAMSGLAVYANIMADATAVPPDAMFAEVGAGG